MHLRLESYQPSEEQSQGFQQCIPEAYELILGQGDFSILAVPPSKISDCLIILLLENEFNKMPNMIIKPKKTLEFHYWASFVLMLADLFVFKMRLALN